MISFKANYITPITIGRAVSKDEIVPYRAALSECNPESNLDLFSLNTTAVFLPRRTGFANSIHDDFCLSKIGELDNKNWVRFLVISKEQKSYSYIRPFNILGLAEISSTKLHSGSVYIDYLQTVKKWIGNNMCFVGQKMLDYIKQTYPNKDIDLNATPSAIKFYKKNGFVVVNKLKSNGLTRMKYFHK